MDMLKIMQGLADPTRLRMITPLSTGELCVCDLVAVLNLPQSTVSRHMARLKNAGLVEDRRDGKWVHYRLHDDKEVKQLVGLLVKNSNGDRRHAKDRERLVQYQKTKECD